MRGLRGSYILFVVPWAPRKVLRLAEVDNSASFHMLPRLERKEATSKTGRQPREPEVSVLVDNWAEED